MNKSAATALLFLLAAALPFVQNISEGAVVFDFNSVPYGGGSAAIESYMKGIYYHSNITVEGGRAENDAESDRYIQAGPSTDPYWVSFSFNDIAITAVSFDWAVENNAFHAYADGVEFFSGNWDHEWSWNDSGIFSFGSSVTTLQFSNSGLGNIGIDNLKVVSVPEPGTIFLLGAGLLTVISRKNLTIWPKGGESAFLGKQVMRQVILKEAKDEGD